MVELRVRVVAEELLDSLPPDHPDARRSRRDLRVLNRLMGNLRWFLRTLPPRLRPGERVLEIGAGEGELGLALQARGVALDGLDLAPRPASWPAQRAWSVADLRRFAGYPGYACVAGNLIFHHLTDDELSALGDVLRRTARLIVASEPKRSAGTARLFTLAARCIGAHRVTLHDGRVSIAAGFRGDELPAALGLASCGWSWQSRTTTCGAYRMVAERNA